MSDSDARFFKYVIGARAFLARASAALAAFDADSDPQNLLRAALELRLGIEARLYENIRGALRTLNKPANGIKGYSATKLLAALTDIDPKAGGRVHLRITSEQTGASHELHYAPVTKELASIHGKLGALLHYSFFEANELWYLKQRLHGAGSRTLLDARDLVQDGIEQLTQATAGTLLAPARFTELVAALNDPDTVGAGGPDDGAA